MNEVIIGEGSYGCTAVRVFDIEGKHHISENNVSYWIHDVYLEMDMVIFKNTEEGKTLTNMIKAKNTLEQIIDFLIITLLKNADPQQIRVQIDKHYAKGFHNGQRSKVMEFRTMIEL